MNFINEKFKIDFPLPTVLRNTVEEAEQLDEDNNEEFYCVADIIDVLAKEAYVNKLITQEQWDILVNRYPCE